MMEVNTANSKSSDEGVNKIFEDYGEVIQLQKFVERDGLLVLIYHVNC